MTEHADEIVELVNYFNKDDLELIFINLEKELSAENAKTNKEERKKILQNCFREVHTLKGTAGMLKADIVGEILHILEDVLQQLLECSDRIVGIKDDKIFDFLLSGLDMTEQAISIFQTNPQFTMSFSTELGKSYKNYKENARDILTNIDNYLELQQLNLDLF